MTCNLPSKSVPFATPWPPNMQKDESSHIVSSPVSPRHLHPRFHSRLVFFPSYTAVDSAIDYRFKHRELGLRKRDDLEASLTC